MLDHIIIYRIQGGIGHHSTFNVSVTKMDYLLLGEQGAVAQAVWERMMGNKKDRWGKDLGEPSETAKMLRALVRRHGQEKVEEQFKSRLSFTCLTPGERL